MRRLITILVTALFGPALVFGSMRRIRVPQEGISPDVAVRPSGEIYLVFVQGKNTMFAVSSDGGINFSPPIRLNRDPETVLAGHERGPKIAVGKDGTLHVVWMGIQSGRLYYARRLPRSETFSQARNLLDAPTHVDGVTVAADDQGNVLVAWLDARLPADSRNPVSLPIFRALSRDNGRMFSPDQLLQARHPLQACACCALKSAAATEDQFVVAFRGAYNNVRDPFLAHVAVGPGNRAPTVTKIQDDKWNFNACPMSGPWIAPGPHPGEIWAAWMSQGHVYYAEAVDNGKHFAKARSPSGAQEGVENHPIVLLNARGEIFFAWEDRRKLRWQITDRAGKVLDSGEAGNLPDNSKATGFVDRVGNFCLVF